MLLIRRRKRLGGGTMCTCGSRVRVCTIAPCVRACAVCQPPSARSPARPLALGIVIIFPLNSIIFSQAAFNTHSDEFTRNCIHLNSLMSFLCIPTAFDPPRTFYRIQAHSKPSVARCTTSSAFSSHSRKKIHLHWSRSTLYHINMHSAYVHLFAFTERMVNAI